MFHHERHKFLKIATIFTAATVLTVLTGCRTAPDSTGSDGTVRVRTCAREISPDGRTTSIIYYDYDEHGRLLSLRTDRGVATEVWNDAEGIFEYTAGEADGTIDQVISYTYSDSGELTGYSDSNLTRRYVWQTSDGIPSSLIVDDGITISDVRFTAEDGRITEVYTLSDGEKNAPFIEAAYDEDGHLISYSEKVPEHAPLYTYRYDQNGALTQVNSFAGPNALKSSKSYRYNDSGDLAETTAEDAYGNIITTSYTYGKNGTLLQIVSDGDDLHAEYEFTYDGKTLETVRCTRSFEGETQVFTYKYDKNGDLIDDGKYTYEYETLHLSQEDAQRYTQHRHILNGVDTDLSQRDYARPYCFLIPSPVPPEYLHVPAFE